MFTRLSVEMYSRSYQAIKFPLTVNKNVNVTMISLTKSKGIIVDGKSSINESMLTGESRPVFKKDGESVYGKFFLFNLHSLTN